jgi:mannosyltransferase
VRFVAKRRRQAVLIAIVLLGLGIRLAVSASRDLWYDEAFSGLVVSQGWHEMLNTIRHDVHPPFYYMLLKVWVTFSGNSVTTIRFFSIFFGVLTVPLAYSFTRRAFERPTWMPVVAGFVFAINPFFVDYSVEARMYSLLVFLMLLAGHFLLSGLTSSTYRLNRDWFLFSICITLGFLSHYVAAIGVLMFYAFATWYMWCMEKHSRGKLRFVKHAVLVSLLPLAAFLWWLPTLLLQIRRDVALRWVPIPKLSNLPVSMYALLFGIDSQASGPPPARELVRGVSSELTSYLLFALVALAAARLIVWKGKLANLYAVFYLSQSVLPLVLVLLAGQLGARLYVERFLIVQGAFFVLLLVFVCGKLKSSVSWPVVGVYALLVLNIFATDYGPSHRFRNLSDSLDRCPEAERIIFSTPEVFVIGKYYLKDRSLEVSFLDERCGNPHEAYETWYKDWAIIREADILTDLEMGGGDIFVGYEGFRREGLEACAGAAGGLTLFVAGD